MPGERNALAAQDSFLDVLLSDIVAGSDKLSAWVSRIESLNGIEDLFELESWLRGLRAFFDIRNLPLSESEQASLVARSFAPEIRIARKAIQLCERRTIDLVRLGQTQQVEFETFIETQLRRDRVIDYHVSRIVAQPTPSDSLHRLLESLSDLSVLIQSLREPQLQDLRLFLSIGRTFQLGLRACRYMDMLLAQRFRLQYDRIESHVLAALLRGIGEINKRRNVALALLYFYRQLRYLKIVERDLAADRPLRQHLVLFALLTQQMGQISDFVKSRLIRSRRAGIDLRNAGELIVHSLKADAQRVLESELVFTSTDNDASSVYARIENSHGILRNCFQGCIIALAQAFDKTIEGKVLFPFIVEGQHKAQKLRQDLWDLRQHLRNAMERRSNVDLSHLMERVSAFRESSLRTLMYKDWGEFERLSGALFTSSNQLEAMAHLRNFIGFLDLLVLEVSKRKVLR